MWMWGGINLGDTPRVTQAPKGVPDTQSPEGGRTSYIWAGYLWLLEKAAWSSRSIKGHLMGVIRFFPETFLYSCHRAIIKGNIVIYVPSIPLYYSRDTWSYHVIKLMSRKALQNVLSSGAWPCTRYTQLFRTPFWHRIYIYDACILPCPPFQRHWQWRYLWHLAKESLRVMM